VTTKIACCVSRAVTSQTGLMAEASASRPAVVTIKTS
jgi:vanillate O-demethylase ferredoxin subunit